MWMQLLPMAPFRKITGVAILLLWMMPVGGATVDLDLLKLLLLQKVTWMELLVIH